VAIAAAKAGAARVLAAEIDHFAVGAIASNAALNGVAVSVTTAEVIDTAEPGWEVVTAGDVCYEQPMADRVAAWLGDLARRGCLVLLGDPGRAYLPAGGLRECAHYVVPTSRDLEDCESRNGIVWEVLPR
jgi:predicted nicotinamide N-methyase